MKNFILGIASGIGIGMIFLGIISANDDKCIQHERKKAAKYYEGYWEGNRQIALYDDEVKRLKKIIKVLADKVK